MAVAPEVYVAPGFYVEVVTGPAGRAISSAPTDIALFVGETAAGEAGLQPIASMAEYHAAFGGFGPPAQPLLLPRSLAAFFANGGRRAVVLPAGAPGAPPLDPAAYRALLDRTLEDAGAAALLVPACAALLDPATDAGNYLAYLGAFAAHVAARPTRDLFLVADLPDQPAAAVLALSRPGGDRVALYWPHLRVADAATGLSIALPPAGAVAGLMARTDADRGVWRAPAGTAAAIHGAVGLTRPPSAAEEALLVAAGINPLRQDAARGVLVWGARCAVADGPAYVPVRRLLMGLERSLAEGLAWTVFEPNTPATWVAVRGRVEGFLDALWRAGAFAGTSPRQAYFVRADATTMTASDIAAGRLVVLVGVAPLRPAEFVTLRIVTWTAAA